VGASTHCSYKKKEQNPTWGKVKRGETTGGVFTGTLCLKGKRFFETVPTKNLGFFGRRRGVGQKKPSRMEKKHNCGYVFWVCSGFFF